MGKTFMRRQPGTGTILIWEEIKLITMQISQIIFSIQSLEYVPMMGKTIMRRQPRTGTILT